MVISSWGKGNGFVWVAVQDVYIYGVYISPNVDDGFYLNWLSSLTQNMNGKQGKIIVAGDFNAKSPLWGAPVEDRRGAMMADWACSLNLIVLNTGEYTFERGTSRSHIDVTLASEEVSTKIETWTVLEEESLSLHKYIKFRLDLGVTTKQWTWRKLGLAKDKFKRLIQEDMTLTNGDTELESVIRAVGVANRAATIWAKTDARGNTAYWWTEEIDIQRNKTNRTRRLFLRSRTRANLSQGQKDTALNEYKTQRRILSKMITREKQQKWKALCKDLEADIWGSGYKIVINALKPKLPYNDMDSRKRLEIINVLFPEAARNPWVRAKVDRRIVPISSEELNIAIGRLKANKAPGPDGIYTEAVKILNEEHHLLLLQVVNRLFTQGLFWKSWKVARVLLIPKPGKPQLHPSDFRPICVIDSMAKLYELLILTRLQEEILRTGDLSDRQYGFRKGRSTVGAIQEVVNRIKNLGHNKWGALLLFDVRNAFNTADWDLIMAKLASRGCDVHLLNIIKQYFTDCRLLVSRELERPVTMGVPQGSILGPILWNILFDDVLALHRDPETHVIAYADDLAVVTSSGTKEGLILKTNKIMSQVNGWMVRNRLQLAIDKTEIVVFCGMRRPKNLRFKIDNRIIDPKREVKYLGVIIDRLMTFGAHICYTAEKAERIATALSRLLPNVGGPPSTKRKVMAQAVMSVILYAAPIWASALRIDKYKRRISGVQRKLALRIASAYRTVSTEAVLVIAGEIPVHIMIDERRRIHSKDGDKAEVSRAERETSLAIWQEEFRTGTKGTWTRCLIRNVASWQKRGYGEINYHITQALSGHGNFMTFLRAIGKAENDHCIYCGDSDTPEHAIFSCPREEEPRSIIARQLGVLLRPDNMIETALSSRIAWKAIFGYIENLMRRRENDLRTVEPNP